MTKLILSTSNIVSGGPSIVRTPGAFRSNLELTSSLRSNFQTAQQESREEAAYNARNGGLADAATGTNGINGHAIWSATASAGHAKGHANGDVTGNANGTAQTNGVHVNGVNGVHGVNGVSSTHGHGCGQRRPPLAAWTQREDTTLYIPRIDYPPAGESATTLTTTADAEGSSITSGGSTGSSSGGLQEEAAQYNTTVKLFFLPGAASVDVTSRAQYVDEALALVFRELGVASVDLLILSFPGMSFEGDCEWAADKINATQGDDDAEAATWAASAETLFKAGKVRRLGVAEFGSTKLERFVARVGVPPSVDQINVHNCCNVPPPLAALAKAKGIELLVHTDCTDVLPPGTLRELLGPRGAGVLADEGDAATNTAAPTDALRGDLTPLWVVKYTAVVRDRGVIENKGYFAGALLHDE
ncbi:glutamate--cysteine ligase regulatory subunit [Sporothrix brasiliensis 5110]|uniref:GCS light chain n=1 Tax=Sporothrix brasiliensis 5110 TaxID=1398154 RepID=A0A0C2J819_9PEZI|nr:glutamate--cysteine ligase regulatory subunit [Sporothrix brasiliensis 5110]KIH93122.1 glutamate--cysteine ligase regulatory subunit [Sporothrix brasiliensis 5110]